MEGQDDLEAAQLLAQSRKFAQAAFYAQQSAEKGLKAVWLALGGDPWGHSVTRLVQELPEGETKEALTPLLEDAKTLDKHDVPARYPDAFPDARRGLQPQRRGNSAAKCYEVIGGS